MFRERGRKHKQTAQLSSTDLQRLYHEMKIRLLTLEVIPAAVLCGEDRRVLKLTILSYTQLLRLYSSHIFKDTVIMMTNHNFFQVEICIAK